LANPKPRYPRLARRRGLEGEVLLEVKVGSAGLPLRVRVVRSSGHPVLDRAALEAVSRWRFAPARRGGIPVTATTRIPVRFRLEG
ncbi:MAG: energy transducer TonB, partial [Gammaproteobacteria bacterium]